MFDTFFFPSRQHFFLLSVFFICSFFFVGLRTTLTFIWFDIFFTVCVCVCFAAATSSTFRSSDKKLFFVVRLFFFFAAAALFASFQVVERRQFCVCDYLFAKMLISAHILLSHITENEIFFAIFVFPPFNLSHISIKTDKNWTKNFIAIWSIICRFFTSLSSSSPFVDCLVKQHYKNVCLFSKNSIRLLHFDRNVWIVNFSVAKRLIKN